jgi:hypothetical protein
MVALPSMYQQAGWLSPTLMMLICAFIGAQASTMLSEAMTKLPGNDVFQSRAEIISLARFYFGRSWLYGLTVALLVFSLLSVNIASIIISAQQMDAALVAIYGTCGIVFYPPSAQCLRNPTVPSLPFGDHVGITLGFVVVLLVAIPMGYFNLDDNIIVQKIAVLLLVAIVCVWVALFSTLDLDVSRLPVWGDNQTSVVGTILFNYTFVTSIPSWVNEKQARISVSRQVNGTTTVGTLIFLVLGVFGAIALKFDNSITDLLKAIEAVNVDSALVKTAHITVYLFPVVAFLSSIPVFAIIIRYNLLQNRICGKAVANFVAVVLPWLISLPFYSGDRLSLVITWSSLFANGIINYVVPMWFFYLSRDKHANHARTQRFVEVLQETVAIEAKERKQARMSPPPPWYKFWLRAPFARASGAKQQPPARVPPLNGSDSDIVANANAAASVAVAVDESGAVVIDDDDDDEHEPTAAEVQMAVIEASIAEQKRLRAHQVRHEAINDVCDGADGEGQSFIYTPEADAAHKFVAWPWTRIKAGRVAAVVMIALTLVLNAVAIAVAIYLCADQDQCGQ